MGKTGKIIIIGASGLLGVAAVVGVATNWNRLARKGADVLGDVNAATVNWDKQGYDNNYTAEYDETNKTATVYYFNDDTQLVKVPGTIAKDGVSYTVTDVRLQNNYAKAVKVNDEAKTFFAGDTEDETSTCASLQYAYLGKGITVLTTGMFSRCHSLKSVSFAGSVTEIQENSFSYSGIESFAVPETVTKFGNAFLSSNIKTLSFKSDSSLGDIQVTGCPYLESVSLPKNNAGKIVINGCPKLQSVALPELTTGCEISGDASLKNVELPSKVTTFNGPDVYLDWVHVKATAFTVVANTIQKKTSVFFDAYKADVAWATLATERTDADQKVYYKGQFKMVNGAPQVIKDAEASVKATTSSSSAA